MGFVADAVSSVFDAVGSVFGFGSSSTPQVVYEQPKVTTKPTETSDGTAELMAQQNQRKKEAQKRGMSSNILRGSSDSLGGSTSTDSNKGYKSLLGE